MFRHQGKTRTFTHNLKIASLLSFVAGFVNVAGFLCIQRLTTNVTGHFALFVDEVFKLNLWQGIVYFFYIFFFFFGSFVSSLLIELMSRKSERYLYVLPASIECAILFTLGFSAQEVPQQHPDLIAFSLLFAMGLQNSLVTKISNASVRTTHLTGLFTDLGIELSQLFFYTAPTQKAQLFSSIKLRLSIISFFFIGGITGAVAYSGIQLYAFLVAAMVLTTGLVYDSIKFRIIQLRRRFKQPVHE